MAVFLREIKEVCHATLLCYEESKKNKIPYKQLEEGVLHKTKPSVSMMRRYQDALKTVIRRSGSFQYPGIEVEYPSNKTTVTLGEGGFELHYAQAYKNVKAY